MFIQYLVGAVLKTRWGDLGRKCQNGEEGGGRGHTDVVCSVNSSWAFTHEDWRVVLLQREQPGFTLEGSHPQAWRW